jgi:hypothetical protein
LLLSGNSVDRTDKSDILGQPRRWYRSAGGTTPKKSFADP